jgi:hypothetical protein
MRLIRDALICSILGLIGCGNSGGGGSATATGDHSPQGHRIYIDVAWDTVFLLREDAASPILSRPALVAARDSLVYVYDYSTRKLSGFDLHGRLIWQFGERGHPLRGLVNPVDLEVDASGAIWLVDAGAGRLIKVSRSGELQRVLDVQQYKIHDVIPLSREVMTTTISEDWFWISFDSVGNLRGRGQHALSEVNKAPPVVRQTSSTGSLDGRAWAAIFPFGSVLTVYEGRTVRCQGRLVEGQPLPQREKKGQPVWAVAATIADSVLYVLPRGRTEAALQSLDEYSTATCKYKRTLRLPRKFNTVTYDSGVLYFVHQKPVPTVVGLRPRFFR